MCSTSETLAQTRAQWRSEIGFFQFSIPGLIITWNFFYIFSFPFSLPIQPQEVGYGDLQRHRKKSAIVPRSPFTPTVPVVPVSPKVSPRLREGWMSNFTLSVSLFGLSLFFPLSPPYSAVANAARHVAQDPCGGRPASAEGPGEG